MNAKESISYLRARLKQARRDRDEYKEALETGADDALLLAAMVRGVAKWIAGGGRNGWLSVPDANSSGRTDYIAALDAVGCPILTDELRAALREVLR